MQKSQCYICEKLATRHWLTETPQFFHTLSVGANALCGDVARWSTIDDERARYGKLPGRVRKYTSLKL
jgi:hypothetical protein